MQLTAPNKPGTQTPRLGEVAQASSDRAPSPDELYGEWKASSKEDDFHKLLTSLEPAIKRGVSAYGGGKDHLRTQARLLAADSVRTYDPHNEHKASLSTWVYGNLRRLQRVAADREAAVRLPERVRVDAILLRDTGRELEDSLGHPPDLQSLAEATGLSRSRIKAAGSAYREISETGAQSDKGDTMGSEVKGMSMGTDPWVDYVYYDLDPKNRFIFERVTGYGGALVLPKADIAKKLKMTPPAISYRISKILEQINQRPSGNIS